jgi:predicted membrane-bound mannosyltransferase
MTFRYRPASVDYFRRMQRPSFPDLRLQLGIFLAALLLFVPFLGSVHLFDWDEVNFAENAREMIVTGDYLHMQIDFEPFYEKPPLFIWMQVVSMKMFGINEFAARLPNAIIGAITLLVVFSAGKRYHGKRFGLLWTVVYAGTLLPHFYARSGIIDPLFNLFIFLSVLAMLRSLQGERSAMVWGGFWSGCAVMTKGPVGAALVVLTTTIAWVLLRKRMRLPWRELLVLGVLTCAVTALWYGVDYLQNGPEFIIENVKYQIRLLTTGDAGHEQPWYYHPLVVLIGCYPASLLMLRGLTSDPTESSEQRELRIWMIVLMCVVLVVFSIVKTKIVHYSSMTYLPLTFLAAVMLDRWLGGRVAWPRWITVGLCVLCVLITSVLAAIPLAGMNVEALLALPTFRDEFIRSAVQQPVPWTWIDVLIPCVLPIGLIAFVILRRYHRTTASIATLFGSVAVMIWCFLPVVAPKIERYTQGAAIDHYTSLIGKDVYVAPLTMKSYAHLFYTQRPYALSAAAHGIPHQEWEPWLLHGPVDKPTTFVCKVNDAARWRTEPTLRVISERGGFVVFERIR